MDFWGFVLALLDVKLIDTPPSCEPEVLNILNGIDPLLGVRINMYLSIDGAYAIAVICDALKLYAGVETKVIDVPALLIVAVRK
jgi:hypothetical protein